MKDIKIKYTTINESKKIAGKVFVLEVIRNLDEAIDELCNTYGDLRDPLAVDLCPYFGFLWPSGVGLAQFLEKRSDDVKGKRVLEIGAGMGLPSLVVKHLGGDVLTTDFHPDVEEYFLRNCRHSSLEIPYRRLNWCEPPKDLGVFEVVIGSDILYEGKHPSEIAKAVTALVSQHGRIIIADPGRSYLQSFVSEMESLGWKHELHSEYADKTDIYILEFIYG